ncbi:unnamed protein product [Symbiodinium natans]|uniref:Uncharacterized protein n=1 Tax=Symbiodinium natans TaxID=878477 RepID=A0A812RLI9_9DINO|nr:unnamed protein product [Symbiodinium natans]
MVVLDESRVVLLACNLVAVVLNPWGHATQTKVSTRAQGYVHAFDPNPVHDDIAASGAGPNGRWRGGLDPCSSTRSSLQCARGQNTNFECSRGCAYESSIRISSEPSSEARKELREMEAKKEEAAVEM